MNDLRLSDGDKSSTAQMDNRRIPYYELETGIKHEHIDGEICAMSGETGRHSLLATNAIIVLGSQLRESSCHIHSSDMQIRINELRYVYPDFSVVCGADEYADEKETLLTNPILICEVMSPSSEQYNSGFKE